MASSLLFLGLRFRTDLCDRLAMLEQLNTPQTRTISRPNLEAVEVAEAIATSVSAPVIAEIGIGVGATTLEFAKALDNRGELHIFDFQGRCAELIADLDKLGFRNVRGHENSGRHWDSYNWSLMKLIRDGRAGMFDFIYLDGAHTFERDACAFFLCDRLLKRGGQIFFDDYTWTVAQSKWLPDRDAFLTKEQIDTPNVKLICDLLVDTDPRYEQAIPTKCWRKLV